MFINKMITTNTFPTGLWETYEKVYEDATKAFEYFSKDIEKEVEKCKLSVPYNIEDHYIEKDGVKEFTGTHLVFALAGYTKEQINVKVANNSLNIIVGKVVDNSPCQYKHRGISQRGLNLKFKLTDNADKKEITSTFKDGILRIVIPAFIKEDSIINVAID